MEETDYSNLTRAQRKKLKRQKRKEEISLEWQKKQRKRKIQNYLALSVIVLVIAAFLYWKLVPPKNAPIIQIEPSSYDFGAVSQAAGVATTTMIITNKGNEELIIKNMDTSCGCTSATITYKGVESPRFSMAGHGTNPRNWELTIPPDDSAKLNVIYDPNVHRDLHGSVTRSVFVYSNDPRNRKQEVRISATQGN